VRIVSPYAHYDIPVIGQAYILFRAVLEPPYSFSPGPETLETRLFSPGARLFSPGAVQPWCCGPSTCTRQRRAAHRPGSSPAGMGLLLLTPRLPMPPPPLPPAEEIPYDSIAFSSVAITLQMWVKDLQQGTSSFHHGVVDKLPGSSPNDPATFKLRDHFALRTVA
jgi:ADP-ribose/FAD diphosphatase